MGLQLATVLEQEILLEHFFLGGQAVNIITKANLYKKYQL